MDMESEMVRFMQPLFGEMADKTISIQKKKLGMEEKKLCYEDYARLIDAIRKLCKNMAGDTIASKIYEGLKDILEEQRADLC